MANPDRRNLSLVLMHGADAETQTYRGKEAELVW